MDSPAALTLEPLPYHRAVVSYLRETEPEVWAWACSVTAQQEHAETVHEELLRQTYRLTPQSHPAAYAAAETAARRLGLALPMTLYQGNDGAMNAALFFLPDELQIIFNGPVLEKLSEPELLALFGHEMAHHMLWTADSGAFHAADRILHHTASGQAPALSHLNTARLFALYTEIFADRGSALAATAAHPAISTLVKVQTGLAVVDAAAYLQQAAEIDARGKGATAEHSHPEAFLRAQAVDRWWRREADTDAWTERHIEGVLAMSRLDIVGQQRLGRLTRGLVARLLCDPQLSSERAHTQAREYFPDWAPGESPLDPVSLQADAFDDSVRDYLCSVLLDFALVDPDLRDDALPAAGRHASALGAGKQMAEALRKHLGMTKRAVDKLAKQWLRENP